MSNLMPYDPTGGLVPRDARRLARVRSRQTIARELRGEAINVETDIAIDKMQNETLATGAAMTAIVSVATTQQNLEQLAPATAGHLALVVDAHAMAMRESLADLHHQLRRL